MEDGHTQSALCLRRSSTTASARNTVCFLCVMRLLTEDNNSRLPGPAVWHSACQHVCHCPRVQRATAHQWQQHPRGRPVACCQRSMPTQGLAVWRKCLEPGALYLSLLATSDLLDLANDRLSKAKLKGLLHKNTRKTQAYFENIFMFHFFQLKDSPNSPSTVGFFKTTASTRKV